MTFRDFTTGEVLTANNLEQYVMRQNGKPVGHFTKSASQSITTGTPTAVTWDQESFDTDGAHSTVTNSSRYTVQTAGKYRIYADVEWGSSSAGTRDISIRLNGVATDLIMNHWGGSLPAANHGQFLAGIVPTSLIVGDYIELFVAQSSGGSISVVNTAGRTFWSVEYVSE